jgi:hypothetical protein
MVCAASSATAATVQMRYSRIARRLDRAIACMSRNVKTCVYCAAAEGRSADHIPPKAIFAKPRPLDLITVPACTNCNASFKPNDEYFAAMLALRTGVLQSTQGRRLPAQVTRGLRHPKGQRFRDMITANWMRADDLPDDYGVVDGPYVYWASVPRLRATPNALCSECTTTAIARRWTLAL